MTPRASYGRLSQVSRYALFVGAVLLVVVSVHLFQSFNEVTRGHLSAQAVSTAHGASPLAPSAQRSLTGRNVVIGIYDSGVNLDNTALISQGQSRVVSQSCVGSNSEVNLCSDEPDRAAQNTCTTTDVGCFHGMAVAGLAAGNSGTLRLNGVQVDVGGVAPDAHISYVRDAMSRDGTIEYNNFVNALNKFVDDVKSGSPAAPDVVNLSLGFPRSSYQDCQQDNASKRAIDFLVNAGVVVVAASGNDSNKNEITYPACMKNVIAVGSSNGDHVSGFSNMSSDIDLVAPGENRWAHLSENSRYVSVKGTSFSAPLVSGAVALIKQKNPTMSPSAVQELLTSTADNAVDPATGISYRRLNIDSALEKISPTIAQAKTVVQPEASAETASQGKRVVDSGKVAVPEIRLNSESVVQAARLETRANARENNVFHSLFLALIVCAACSVGLTWLFARRNQRISSQMNHASIEYLSLKHLE